MNVTKYRDMHDKYAGSAIVYIPEINMIGSPEIGIVREFAKLNKDNEVTAILKSFNDDIVNFNSQLLSYTLNNGENITLSLAELGSGERLFVMCYMADSIKRRILVQNELEQSDHNNKARFLNYLEQVSTSIYLC